MLFGIRLATATFDALLVQPDGSFQDIGTLVEYAERGVLKQFAELRIAELFSIIIDYPDSKAAIDDLRMCVAKLGNMRHMANLLRNAIQKRLLHPGATTNDILTQYISSIRCLRLLDPSSTVLEIVAQPIREYLRSREDTVSCIVQDMVSEESELFEDLASGQGLIMENGPDGIVYDEEYANKNWEPLPIEAKNVFVTAQRRDADVLSLLVSIYDTKDVFVHEFEKYLEQQLLYCTEYNTEREIKQVEMMKLRFGDHALERCEVMLKDIADSKRIAQYVDETSKSKLWDMPMQATIVSRQFWAGAPKEEEYKDPKEMAEICERYASVYEMLKPARKLEWRGSQSQISLSIELADRTLEVTVKPAQAAVLFTFQEYGTQTLADIAKSLGCTEDFALSRIRFWQARGIVRETESNTFEVIENENKSNIGVGAEKTDEDDDDENGESAAEASTARTEILRMNFKYIVGMLTNLGPLPLDRILSMLSMFVPGESTTPDELRDFLAQMVREDQLEMTGGMYKLK
ncbi:anaphase promoting complex subunit 2 [Coemansia spiralis]|nr:anaphase promoting complex subunit 2 [Coemansia spiralis]